MKQGNLYFNGATGRVRAVFLDDQDDLHCGMTMEALVDGEWIPTRLEKRDDWYLVGLFDEGPIPLGQDIRL